MTLTCVIFLIFFIPVTSFFETFSFYSFIALFLSVNLKLFKGEWSRSPSYYAALPEQATRKASTCKQLLINITGAAYPYSMHIMHVQRMHGRLS